MTQGNLIGELSSVKIISRNNMFEDIQIEATNQLSAAKTLCDEVNESFPMDSSVELRNNVCKGLCFVVLYGALEYTITSVVSATIQKINDININSDLLKPRLLTLSLNPKCNALRDSANKKWLKQYELFSSFETPTVFSAETCLFPAERGNIKYHHIDFVWKIFGLRSDVVPDLDYRGLFDTVAEKRMAIAHGRISPQNIGRSYSKEDIIKYHEKIKTYCFYVLNCFETYFVNEEYLKTNHMGV